MLFLQLRIYNKHEHWLQNKRDMLQKQNNKRNELISLKY